MRLRLLSAALVVVSTLAACGGSDGPTNPATVSVAGAYTLRTINGGSLPYTLASSGANKVEILDDVITLTDGGTFTENGHARTTDNGAVTTENFIDVGTYARNGSALTLTYSDRSTLSGSVSNGTLHLSQQGAAFVFTR